MTPERKISYPARLAVGAAVLALGAAAALSIYRGLREYYSGDEAQPKPPVVQMKQFPMNELEETGMKPCKPTAVGGEMYGMHFDARGYPDSIVFYTRNGSVREPTLDECRRVIVEYASERKLNPLSGEEADKRAQLIFEENTRRKD